MVVYTQKEKIAQNTHKIVDTFDDGNIGILKSVNRIFCSKKFFVSYDLFTKVISKPYSLYGCRS